MRKYGIFGSNFTVGLWKIKVVVKDTIDIENYPTRAASPALANIPVATQHAVVKNILDQDCQIIGKANLHELAFGITGLNSYTGNPINLNILTLFQVDHQVDLQHQLLRKYVISL